MKLILRDNSNLFSQYPYHYTSLQCNGEWQPVIDGFPPKLGPGETVKWQVTAFAGVKYQLR